VRNEAYGPRLRGRDVDLGRDLAVKVLLQNRIVYEHSLKTSVQAGEALREDWGTFWEKSG
jgi:hypothetical protein